MYKIIPHKRVIKFINSRNPKDKQRIKEKFQRHRGFSLVQEHKLLLKKHIIEIQQVLEKNNAGIRTQAGTTLKNEKTGEVIYTPPQSHQDIQHLIDNLEQYINNPDMDDYDTLVKMAIIHYQFESIHPFYDGNGRTGRIINILYLMLNGLLELPILYLSSYIIKNKSDYYRLLTEVRTKNSWEEWILYMLDGIETTSKESVKLIADINVTMTEVKLSLKNKLPKIYSKDLLEFLFKHPYTKIAFLVDELGVTRKTATSYLRAIEDIGILKSTKIGRDVYFINKQLFSLLQNK